jgi:hypothetical protein
MAKKTGSGSKGRGRRRSGQASDRGLAVKTTALTRAAKAVRTTLKKNLNKAESKEDIEAAIEALDDLLDLVGCQGTSMTRVFR